ncbi:MAG TPA: M20/M25/M40 family metallo-hydrolase [Pyrinomonadaceae bacterium]|nr:M20/M25/M40 family metallo-hydrolase [Pyrinomonadaceae bacterium]
MLKISNSHRRLLFALVLSLVASAGGSSFAQQRAAAPFGRGQSGGGIKPSGATTTAAQAAHVSERNVRAHMEFLASDAMQGRGSGTQFELLAGLYIASQLRQYGIEPAGDEGTTAGQKSFIQTVKLTRQAFADAPSVSFSAAGGAERRWVHGREMLVTRITTASLQGALQKLRAGEKPAAGAFVLMTQGEGDGARQLYAQASAMGQQGAGAVFVEENAALRRNWATLGEKRPELPLMIGSGSGAGNVFVLSTDAFKELQTMADGTQISFAGTLGPAETNYTWNVLGVLPGADAKLASEAVLLSAHMDHIGVGAGQTGDRIYNGADDDASGVVAVLELARALGAGARPKRTVYFVLFGSEERGGYGSQYFLSRPPVALTQMVANLQFEMIGRPDPKVAADTLWLTGYERSNLGAELARQGARLVQDPHPQENFFQRSDNYALARRGVVAHTVSSFGLHPQYHKPDDDITHIDFAHMTRAINSMLAPVSWLVNSNFTPAWAEGKKP